MNGEKFNSDRAPVAVGLYPHARKVGNLLFLSGVGPRKAGHTDIPGVTLNENGEIDILNFGSANINLCFVSWWFSNHGRF